MKTFRIGLVLSGLFLLQPCLFAQFYYFTNGNAITITGYSGNNSSGPVVIPDFINGLAVTSISNSAFEDSEVEFTGVIPESVTNIGASAFYGCYLPEVSLGSNVISIGKFAFDRCGGLSDIAVDAQNTNFSSVDGVLFNKSQTILLQYPGDDYGGYTIPSGVVAIGDDAFDQTPYLTSVVIPDSLTSIGDGAFYECLDLTNVSFGNGVTNISDLAFQECDLTSIVFRFGLRNIGSYTFAYNERLTKVYFQGNAPFIDPTAFEGDNVTLYYLLDATGWSSNSFAAPAVLWDPLIQAVGFRSNQFGFYVAGTTNIPIAVQASSNLANGVWTTVQSCAVTNGSTYFADPAWTNFPNRFYRIGFQ